MRISKVEAALRGELAEVRIVNENLQALLSRQRERTVEVSYEKENLQISLEDMTRAKNSLDMRINEARGRNTELWETNEVLKGQISELSTKLAAQEQILRREQLIVDTVIGFKPKGK